MKRELVKEYSGGFTFDKNGKPVFRFVEAVRWFEPEMGKDIPEELAPWYRQMAEALDMDFYAFWMMAMVKSLVVTADEPVTLEMAIHDADCHRHDPTYPIDFSSQLKKSMNEMGDRENILARLRQEVANFEAYMKARSEWLTKETKRVRTLKEMAEFTAKKGGEKMAKAKAKKAKKTKRTTAKKAHKRGRTRAGVGTPLDRVRTLI